jgi:DNA adenine methylase
MPSLQTQAPTRATARTRAGGGDREDDAFGARPFLKWAGGKKQLLAAFAPLYPAAGSIGGYHEPFLGSGAVFFHVRRLLRPRRVTLSDSNSELIGTFTAVRDEVEAVILELERHRRRHKQSHFYEVRDLLPLELFPAARAARLIYLNRTCFNGLYRVNSKGHFNVPMGRYTNPTILDEAGLRLASASLARTQLHTAHFREVLGRARAGDFVYFDPPYVPVSPTSDFTAYTRGSFGEHDQAELARVYRELDARGCKLMLSNSDTPVSRRLYAGFQLVELRARRSINSRADRRGTVGELVVLNYEPAGDGPRSTASAKAAKLRKRGTAVSR